MLVVVGLSLKALGAPPDVLGDTEHPENTPINADRFKLGLIKPGTKFNVNFSSRKHFNVHSTKTILSLLQLP